MKRGEFGKKEKIKARFKRKKRIKKRGQDRPPLYLMKKSGLKNRFNQEKLKSIWCFNNKCLWCEKPAPDAFHHIISPSSPKYKKGHFNNSILNACPIHNGGCHLYNPELHKEVNEKRLLIKVIKYLVKNDYGFTQKDIEFYKAYRELYS